MFLAMGGLFWFQITQKEEAAREIIRKVPLRGVDRADLKFPDLDRLRRKKWNRESRNATSVDTADVDIWQVPARRSGTFPPCGTYGANTSADSARHSMADGDKGGLFS